MKSCPKCGTEYPDTTTLCPSDGTVLERESDFLLGKTLAGKYRIDEKLSEGGMGAVYRGTHVLMDKTVAIKVLRPSLAADEKIVARFSREARAASRISHPHALTVTDFGEDEQGVVFLVMEYLSGKTLKQIIREGGPMELPRVVEILKQVASALDAAHEQGVVHRDLKSDNIMLVTTGGGDYAKVLDFGIAKIREPEGEHDPGLTAPDLVIGTPQYMSPEQCSQSSDIDARSDVYSLGVILFEMLVGHVPFTGPSPTTIMMKHLQDAPPSVLNERPDLPPVIGSIVSRAMAKLPANRYQTAGALVEDLSLAAETATQPRAETSKATAPNRAVPAELDEQTVVRPRAVVIPTAAPPYAAPVSGPPVSTFNPWKVLIPSLAGLLVLFGVIYAFTRNSQTTTSTGSSPSLVADPNSQAVQPSPPATGKSEADIPVGGTANQAVTAPNANASPTASEDVNANQELNPNSNAPPSDNANANTNANSRTAPPLPSPSRSANSNTEPEVPGPGVNPSPKPTLPSPKVSPTIER